MPRDRENPYRSPRSEDLVTGDVIDRRAALLHIHVALAVLVIPTVCNWAAMFVLRSDPTDDLNGLRFLLGIINAAGLIILFLLLWFLTLPLCELVTKITHRFMGKGISRAAWMSALYQSIQRVPRAAVIGGVIWLVWLWLFFFAGHPGGFALDVCFQLAGHTIAAWVYVPMLYRWYVLRTQSSIDSSIA